MYTRTDHQPPRRIGILIAIMLSWTTLPALAALQITGVTADQDILKAGFDRSVNVRFMLNTTAAMRLRIYDARDYLVRDISARQQLPAGEHTLSWDLRDSTGRSVPPEVYYYTLEAEAGEQKAIYDLSDATGGQTVDVTDVTYDADKGIVRYALIRRARLFLRAGIEDGPMLATLINARIQTAGMHELPWDGWDAEHTIQFGKHPKLTFYGQGYQLSRNALIVTDEAENKIDTQQNSPTWLMLQDATPQKRQVRRRRGLDPHFQHDRAQCRDFNIYIRIVGEYERDTEGIPILTGPTSFRVDVAGEDTLMLAAQRLEVSYFLDNRVIYENEVAYTPNTWHWDPKGLRGGTHYLTALIVGFGGHIGTATLKFKLAETAEIKNPMSSSSHSCKDCLNPDAMDSYKGTNTFATITQDAK